MQLFASVDGVMIAGAVFGLEDKMGESRFSWTDFYMEFADRLLDYRNDRAHLIDKIFDAFASIGMKRPKLDSGDVPSDIDPFTIFGLFNKGITDLNRNKIIGALAEEFGVAAKQPTDFSGVPLLNNLNATFYAFSDDPRRGPDDIENLWCVFEEELALALSDSKEARAAFAEAFDRAVGQFGIGWKLSMGLYWVRPFQFVNMDSRNRWYAGDMAGAGQGVAAVFPKEKDTPITDGFAYLSIRDEVIAHLGAGDCPHMTLPELSDAAFSESERVNRERRAAAKASAQKIEEAALGDADVESVRYWLYAPGESADKWTEFFDAGVMSIGWSELGNLSAYSSKEEIRLKLVELRGGATSRRNAAFAVWQFAHDVKPGDIVFAKQGRSKILGRGIVTGDYVYDASEGKYPNSRSVEWTHKGEWALDTMVVMKTLTDVTDYSDLVTSIEMLIQGEDCETIASSPIVEYPSYGKDDFLAEVYMSQEQYDSLCGILRVRKNVILQGAPGVGKTFAAKRLAYSMMGLKDPDRVMMVQFHQSYCYEDFIEGYRPTAGGFELAKGSFYSFCKRASDDGENDYFFIIDEINRGNLSKIFGELFMLIENDKRGPKNKLQLLYSRELFYVPSNVYLIGMMNTADRSLAMLDYALRRRFAFFDMRPAFASEGFVSYREGLASAKFDALVTCVERLNEDISADETLGEGFCIGHSYFCGMMREDAIDAKLSAIVEYELVPMLREYWFDEPSKVHMWSESLRKAIK